MKKLLIILAILITLLGCNEDRDFERKCRGCPVSTQSVPEPGTFILFGAGLIALAVTRKMIK